MVVSGVYEPITEQQKRIHEEMFVWWEEFMRKNQDYQTSSGNVSENFGLMGQYMKLTDKIHKLRRYMWDLEVIRQAVEMTGSKPNDTKLIEEFSPRWCSATCYPKPYNFEGAEEQLRDIIGHAFLALDFINERNKK